MDKQQHQFGSNEHENNKSSHFIMINSDLQQYIFLFLDYRSIINTLKTSKAIGKNLEQNFWKLLTLRDYKGYLITQPAQSIIFPKYQNDVIVENEPPEEAKKDGQNPLLDDLTEQDKLNFENNMAIIINWYEFYKKCAQKIDLNGLWIGDYDAHGFEELRIYHFGYKIRAVKITGDPNVPAKKVTWEMIMNEELTQGKGRIHLADTDFRNSKWSTAYIIVNNKNQIITSWFYKYTNQFWIKLSYGNHRQGTYPFMSRKQELIPLLHAQDNFNHAHLLSFLLNFQSDELD